VKSGLNRYGLEQSSVTVLSTESGAIVLHKPAAPASLVFKPVLGLLSRQTCLSSSLF
jgi:hypothetical protein